MAENRNTQYRYQVLDRCFKDHKRKYTFEDLLEIVNEHLNYLEGPDAMIKERQLRNDIRDIRKMLPDDIYLDAVRQGGPKQYYRYSDPDFSIFKTALSLDEVGTLTSALNMLRKFRGPSANAWLEEVITNLELRFGIKTNSENLISFQQNDRLVGLEHLSGLIDATVNHQAIEVTYTTYAGKSRTHILHPYFMKQYNNRWFLFGMNDFNGKVQNLALDRIENFRLADADFKPNKQVDFQTYFNNVVGVTVPAEEEQPKVETIRLRFTPTRFKYAVSKPIHPSQRIEKEEDCVLSLKVIPTRELDQQLLSFGSDIEVLSPETYREHIAEIIIESAKKY